jgi:uncharacterized protein
MSWTRPFAARPSPRASDVALSDGCGVPWRDVIVFVVLAYGIAWVLWSPLVPTIAETLSMGRTPEKFHAGIEVAIGMYAPAVAALVMRLFVSREGLRGVLGGRPRVWHIVSAVLLPIAIVLGAIAVVVATGIGDATPGGSWIQVLGLLLLAGVPIGAVLAFGEEFGWRGYLLPKLLPLGEVKAAVIVGLVWGPWHLPVLLAGLNYPGENVLALLATFMISVIVLSLLHARFFVASGASLIIVALLHGSLNTFSDRLTDGDHLSGNPLLVSGGGLIASAIVIPVVAIAYWVARRRRVAPATHVEQSKVGGRS